MVIHFMRPWQADLDQGNNDDIKASLLVIASVFNVKTNDNNNDKCRDTVCKTANTMAAVGFEDNLYLFSEGSTDSYLQI